MLPEKATEALETKIASWQTELSSDGINWTDRSQLHFTIRFIGETHLHRARLVADAGHELAEKMTEFKMLLGSRGAFPTTERPGSIWIGADIGGEELGLMAHWMENRLIGMGFRREPKAFNPHLTVARIKSYNSEAAASKWLKSVDQSDPISTEITSFSLVQSIPSPTGSTYRVVEHFPLQSEPVATKIG